MWLAQHSPTPSRVSARNVDLRTVTEQPTQPPTYPLQTEMWATKYQQSRSSSIAYSVLSPQSLRAAHEEGEGEVEDDDEDDSLSQDTDSTACSIADATTALKEHIEILSPNKYEVAHVDATAGTVAVLTDFPSQVHEALEQVSKTRLTMEENPPATMIETIDKNISNDDEKSTNIEEPSKLAQTATSPNSISSEITTKTTTTSSSSSSLSSLSSSSTATAAATTTTKITTTPTPSGSGPLKDHLLALVSRIDQLESSNQPTILAADYAQLERQNAKLEAEKANLTERHEALFALRDADVANLVQVRALLARERREHEAMRKLRDDDLQNVLELRNKLAQATWSASSAVNIANKEREAQRVEKRQSLANSNNNNDLWQIAKTAALEQRVLELESANADLRGRLLEQRSRSQLEEMVEKGREQFNQNKGQLTIPTTAGSRQDMAVAMDALFEMAFRHHDQHHMDMEVLRGENKRLKEELDEKVAQMERERARFEERIRYKEMELLLRSMKDTVRG